MKGTLCSAAGDLPCCKIITVSGQSETALGPLVELMTREGCAHIAVPRPEDLPRAFDESDAVVAVVYDDEVAGNACKSLLALNRAGKVAPVIVVSKRHDFGLYYELMCDGAYDCFSIDEGWNVIRQAARWAARTRAISPGNRSRMAFAAVA